MTVGVYNPQHLGLGRAYKVSKEMIQFDVDLVVGTGLQRHTWGIRDGYQGYDMAALPFHHMFSFGRSPRGNASTGVAVLLGHEFCKQSTIIGSAVGKGAAVGRAGFLRIGGGLLSSACLPIYMSPKGSIPKLRFINICNAIQKFVLDNFGSCPQRIILFGNGDINDTFLRDATNDQTVGPFEFGRKVGYASEACVSLCRKLQLSIANTGLDAKATYFCHNSSSRTGYLFRPQSMVSTIIRCFVPKRFGRRLQNPHALYCLGHFPLKFVFPFDRPVCGLLSVPFRLDFGKLPEMLRGSLGLREELINAVEGAFKNPDNVSA